MSDFLSDIEMSTIFMSVCLLLKKNVYNFLVRVSTFEKYVYSVHVHVSTLEKYVSTIFMSVCLLLKDTYSGQFLWHHSISDWEICYGFSQFYG